MRDRKFAVISDAVNRPAPRIVSAIEDLAGKLHPEAFAGKSVASKSGVTEIAEIEFVMRPLTLRRLFLQCAILGAILFVVVIIALKVGAVQVSLWGLGRDLLRVLYHHGEEIKSDYGLIVMDIRLPRILLGIFVGASLSVAGTGFQALLRNPLADPYVLGVSSGAALGAILALIVAPHLTFISGVRGLAHSVGRFSGSRRNYRRGVCSRASRRAN